MSEFFQILIQSNTLNFLIVLALLVFLIKKINADAKIEHIRNEIRSYVENSEKEKENAEKSLNEIEEKIESLPEEINKIKESTDISVNSMQEKIKADTESKKADILNNSERIMQLEIKKFKSKLISILSEKSVETACLNARKSLNNNRELHNIYIEQAIDEIDGIIL